MKRPKRLSATFVNTVNVAGRYGDGRGGHGLSLLVKKASTGGFSKSWTQRIRLDGKTANVSLGAYPVVTLARARQKALDNARIVSEGRDPRNRASRAPTLEQAVETVIAIHAANRKDGGKSAAQWRASLRDYSVPKIGTKRVDSISTAELVNACAAILGSLPEWFGDANAVSAYLNEIPALDTYVALRDAEVVGFASVERRGAHVAEVHVMGVARKERGRGVGRALLSHVVADLAALGLKLLAVQTLGASDPSPEFAQTRAFYEAMGFLPLVELRQEGWTDPTLIMVRSLQGN